MTGAGSKTRESIVEEAIRIVEEANRRGLALRLIGGLAIHLRGGDGLPEARAYPDIDLVTLKGLRKPVSDLLVGLGYQANARFNTISEARLIFYDLGRERHADVFVGELRMCHRIPITERIRQETPTIPLAELLLTKLQIVRLNEKDLLDVCALLQAHDVGDEDGDTVNAGFIARLCASDWGLWRTTKMNIERCRDGVDDLEIGVETGRLVQERLERLWARIEQEPKSLRWRGRARVGDRVRWYEEPEEVAHGL